MLSIVLLIFTAFPWIDLSIGSTEITEIENRTRLFLECRQISAYNVPVVGNLFHEFCCIS